MAKKLNLEMLLLPVFLVLLISSKPYMASASIKEANALLNWKASFANQTQSRLPSWNLLSHKPSTTSPCTWFGIFCNSAGSVIKINITGFGLNGAASVIRGCVWHCFAFVVFSFCSALAWV
ncbi:hypothetical protein QYF36_022785 [Acer negundo]|nr:hypothetical protein QYF36_022785 [Acer negundo]